MPDIVIAEPMHEAAVYDLGSRFDVRYDTGLAGKSAALGEALAEARALIVSDRTVIDADLLALAPRLQVIGCLGALGRLVDEDACRRRGIEVHAVVSGDGGLASGDAGLADRVMAALGLLAAAAGCRLGLVGFGPAARAVAERARSAGFSVAAYDPMVDADDPVWAEQGVTPLPLWRLLEDSDAVSLHIALTEETSGLIDWETLAEMRPGAVLVNAGAASLVDAGAVAAALRAGRLGGAVLDLDAPADDPEPRVASRAARIGAMIAAKVRAALERPNGEFMPAPQGA